MKLRDHLKSVMTETFLTGLTHLPVILLYDAGDFIKYTLLLIPHTVWKSLRAAPNTSDNETAIISWFDAPNYYET